MNGVVGGNSTLGVVNSAGLYVAPQTLPNPNTLTVTATSAADATAKAGAAVTLLEGTDRLGTKILMSGGTRCNVTHREVTERDFRGGSRPVIARILRALSPEATRAWFESIGVGLKLEPTGKYFPVTDDAHTVLAALRAEAIARGVTLRSGVRIIRIERAAACAMQDSHTRRPSPTERSYLTDACIRARQSEG